MSDWYERYQQQINEIYAVDLYAEQREFYDELCVAFEDFLIQNFNAQLDAWVTTDPDEFMGR